MMRDVIVVLKERNGSSQVAIQKFIEEKYKHLPATFRKLLLIQLKHMVASGKLVRLRHSFKLARSSKLASTKPRLKAKEPAITAKLEAKVEAAAKERKSDASSVKKRKAVVKPATKAKEMTSPGKKVEKPKKTAVMKQVKSPMKKGQAEEGEDG